MWICSNCNWYMDIIYIKKISVGARNRDPDVLIHHFHVAGVVYLRVSDKSATLSLYRSQLIYRPTNQFVGY
jgi:hypothetical protein